MGAAAVNDAGGTLYDRPMNTFLPYASFSESMRCLDMRRLGKQRVEAWQILRALRGETSGWRNHPATKMWEGHERALALYGAWACVEWSFRGYRDSMLERFELAMSELPLPEIGFVPPPWLGDERLHSSHRSNLLRKAPEHYLSFGWTEGPGMPYYWPTR